MIRLHTMLNNRRRFVLSAALAAAFILLAGGANALANTVWCVPSLTVNPSCTKVPTPDTINGAAGAASSGDVIVVGPGTYHESVYVGTSNLSIFGAQAGNDARADRHGPESIVDATGLGSGPGSGAAFDVQAGFVVIDGFTIQGGTGGANASGIYDDGYPVQILNNIIQNNALGMYENSQQDVLVEYNLFKTNNAGAAGANDTNFVGMSGFGIAGVPEQATAVTENAFEGNLAAAMYMYSGNGFAITGNTSRNDGSFVVLNSCSGWSVSGSSIFSHNQGRDFGAEGFLPVYGSTNADAAIDVVNLNTRLQINDNDLEEGETPGYNGIAFGTIIAPGWVCVLCQVSKNTIKGFAGNGIVAGPASSAGTLNGSLISRNDVEENGNDGILIGPATFSGYNMFFDNKAEGNRVFDCADETTGTFTAGTYNTWFNNVGNTSSPTGLCTPGRSH